MTHTPIHTVNSTSNNNGKVVAAAGDRVKINGLNLRVDQAVSLPHGMKHEILVVPQSSTPSFGGFFTIDIREKNIILNEMILQIVLGPVTGTSLVGYFNPSHFFFTRIEIVVGGNVIDTVWGNESFIRTQLLKNDETRLSDNNMAGNYASSAQRTLLSSQTTTNTFYIPLKSFIRETKLSILTEAHNVQLRVYMDTLPNVFTVTSGTLLTAPILYANAICKVTRLDAGSAQHRLQDMHAHPHHSIMHDVRYGTFTVAAGTTTATIVLSPIVGDITALLFTVRASTVGTGAWNYTQLSSFAILDGSSTNIVGGQPLPASLCANVLNQDFCKSSYTTETSFGINDQKANIYIWSFSADFLESLTHGKALTSRQMRGSEQLQLVFPAALGAQVQVDVYAYNEMYLEQATTYVKKINL